MARQLPAILGLMACERCLSVVAFTAATLPDFARNDGAAWQNCPGCRHSTWFLPFGPTLAPMAPHGHTEGPNG